MYPKLKFTLAAILVAQLGQYAHAQQLPDASVLYPETQPRLAPPAASPSFGLEGSPLERSAKPGGETFVLKEVRFEGNTALGSDYLNGLVQPYLGKPTDLAALQDIANAVSAHYREAGYPFARVYLPRQDVANGTVAMQVLEGRFGEIAATVDDHVAKSPSAPAQAYLASIQKGEVIEGEAVERIALIMNDMPGYTAVPIVRPGAEVGTGDLEMRLTEDDDLLFSVGVDNHGSRYTGQYRTRVDVAKARNFIFGDELRVTGLLTDGKTGMLYAGYSFPLQPNGLRLDLSAVHSDYTLSGDWMTGAGFKGKADILGAQVTYPQIRSQTLNVTLSAAFQQKRYVNEIGTKERYTVNALPLAVNFDKRDQFNGGGVTYGVFTLLAAQVSNDNSDGGSRDRNFSKVNLDIARLQRVSDRVQASVKASGQYTEDNIDSTEFISISGPAAVRAFPVGEFSGHHGWTAQTELAYNVSQYHVSPYVFYDFGNATNTTTGLHRTLSGVGVGARYVQDGWSMDLTASWAKAGAPSEVEPGENGARIWAAISKRF